MTTALALVAAIAAAGAAPAEPAPRIELYTMGQGELLFERYGHAALCAVYDVRPERTRCYNYGTTDFESPPAQLGWRFMRGTSRFWVSVWPLDKMIRHYERKDRTIWRQRLPLSDERARAIADKLAFDALEENRYYLYHHFDDNCTTRVRDIIDDVTGGALSRDSDEPVGASFRELGRRGLAEMTELVVIAHFMLGRDADDIPTLYEAMFLPDVLRDAVTVRLDAPPEVIYRRTGRSFPTDGDSGKLWILVIALIVAVPTVATRLAGRLERVGIGITATVLTLIGALLWFIAVISHMPELRYNEALLVFWPTDVLLVAFGPTRRRAYARVRVIALLVVSFALAVGIFRQPLLVPLLIPLLPCLLLSTGDRIHPDNTR